MHPDVLVVRHPELGAVQLLSREGRLRRHQRRRRQPRASDPGAARRAHHPPPQGPARRASSSRSAATSCTAASRAPTSRCSTSWARGSGSSAPRTLLPAEIDRLGVEVFHDMERPRRCRHRHDAAPADRAHARQLRALDARVFPFLRPRLREARRRQARCADHASGTDEPRRRDRQRGRRRHRPQRHPPAGRDGRRRAHGVPRAAGARPRNGRACCE